MHFFAHSKEAAETHDQRTPAHRINMRPHTVTDQQLFMHMEFYDVHLERIGADVFSE